MLLSQFPAVKDHTALTNIGTNTHAQIDSHISDSTIHFLQSAIDHAAILNIGSNSHAAIDSHIGDATIHYTEASISHLNIGDIGSNSHAAIDTHIADATIHFTVGSIDHGLLAGLPDDDHAGHPWLLGRSGGQDLAGGTVAGNTLSLRGSTSSPDVGRINIYSPVEYFYDTDSNTTPAEAYLIRWRPVASVAGYVGGYLNTAQDITATSGVYIPGTFVDNGITRMAAVPGFAAYTWANVLHTVRNSGNFNLPNALVMNIGIVHERNTSGTSTASTMTGFSFSPQTRATASGAVMTKTTQAAVTVRPTTSTATGSTVNLGTVIGLQMGDPGPALFQPNNGSSTMTANIGLDCLNVTFGGNVTKAAVRSAQAAASNAYFLLQTGAAQSQLLGSVNFAADLVGCQFGASNDTLLAWAGAGFQFMQFTTAFATQLRWSNPSADRLLWNTASGAGEFNFNCLRFSMGSQTGANGNQIGNFVAGADTVTIGGEYSQFLLTQAGNVTVNANISAYGWTINAPSFTAGTGTLTTAAALNVGGNVNLATVNRIGVRIISNPTGGSGVNAALWVTAGRSQFDGFVDLNKPIALGGGAVATLGTIGATGPTAAAQAQWVQIEVNGVNHWIAAWA